MPLLGVWDSFDQIDFDKLPQQFVLKTNHASAQIIVCKDKATFNKKRAKKKFDRWMSDCWSEVYATCELHYRDIPRKITAEQYLQQLDGGLTDYRFHCFSGKAQICQAMQYDDLSSTHMAGLTYYDRNWQNMGFNQVGAAYYEKEFEKPAIFDQMIHLAERLAEPFCYVRVDFYDLASKILFGELTFTPCSGTQKWDPPEANERLGAMLTLPKERYILPAVR